MTKSKKPLTRMEQEVIDAGEGHLLSGVEMNAKKAAPQGVGSMETTAIQRVAPAEAAPTPEYKYMDRGDLIHELENKDRELAAARAELEEAATEVDEGSVRVPVEPTEAMKIAGEHGWCFATNRMLSDRAGDCYRAMLAVAKGRTWFADWAQSRCRHAATPRGDPMENWLMKPSLEWLEQANHGGGNERCKMIAGMLRDLWRNAPPMPPAAAQGEGK